MNTIIKLSIPDIRCGVCAKPIQNTIDKIAFVKSATVDIVDQCVSVEINDLSSEINVNDEIAYKQKIKDELMDIGFNALDFVDATTPNESQQNIQVPNSSKIIRKHVLKGLLSLTLGCGMLALGFIGGISTFAMYLIASLSTVATLYVGADTFKEAYKKLIYTKKLTMDSLFSLSAIAALGTSIVALLVPTAGLPLLFDSALLIFGFRHIGKAIEEKAKTKIIEGLNFRSRVLPFIEISESDVKAPVNKLKPGHIIVVRPGQIIPVDCEIQEIIGGAETILIYDTIVTGDTLPTVVGKTQKLLAGIKLAEGNPSLRLKVIRPAAQSYLAHLDQNITEARKEKAEYEDRVEKIMQYFIPIVLGIASLVGLFVGCFFTPVMAIKSAITILVSACPCTLGFIVPLSIKLGIAKAAALGAQFKNGKVLQAADEIDTVVFDLNGTLTQGKPEIKAFHLDTNEKRNKNFYLKIIQQLEKNSQHPIGKAIKDYVSKSVNSSTLEINAKLQATGVTGNMDGHCYVLGNKTLMDHHLITLTKNKKNSNTYLIYFARDNQVIGYFEIVDPLRKDAIPIVNSLQATGKNVYLCTGADKSTALVYAKQLHIPAANVMAKCKGSLKFSEKTNQKSKPEFIQNLIDSGKKVAMVGDAGNDVIAMEKANIGISVQSKTLDEITQNNASVVINSN